MQTSAESLIKPCCGESNNIACLAMFKSLTEKHHTINHLIILNDPVSKFHQCRIWGFCREMSTFFSICLGKKNAEVTKFLGILKNMSPRIKYIFVPKKSNVSLNKKVIFVFSHSFQIWFHKADHLLCYPQISVFSFHTIFISVSKK